MDSVKPWYENVAEITDRSREALEERRKLMTQWDRQKREHVGPFFRNATDSGQGSTGASRKHKRHRLSWLWMSRVLPELCAFDPRFSCESMTPGVGIDKARTLEVALDQIASELGLAAFLRDGPLMHAQWYSGWVTLGVAPVKGMQGVEIPTRNGVRGRRSPMRPVLYCIPPEMYFEDPVPVMREELTFQGRDWIRTKADLLEEAEAHPERGWNTQLIRRMHEDDDFSDLGRKKDTASSNRGEVHGQTIWVPHAGPIDPENTPERGFHGILLTMPAPDSIDDGVDVEWLRPPRDAFVPEWGPFYPFGMAVTPGHSSFVGPLTASQYEVDQLSDLKFRNDRNGAAYKRMTFVKDRDGKLVQKVRSGRHHHVYGVQGDFSSSDVATVEQGGLTDQMLVQEQRFEAEVEELTGLSEVRSGQVQGEATATENQLAYESGNVRQEDLEGRTEQAVSHLARGIAWYLIHSQEILFPLNSESKRRLGYRARVAEDESGEPLLQPNGQPVLEEPTVWFRGGIATGVEQDAIGNYSIKVTPRSMSRKTKQRDLQATVSFWGWMRENLDWLMTHPQVNAMETIDDVAVSMGLPPMSRRLDAELHEVLSEQILGAELQLGLGKMQESGTFAGLMSGGGQSVATGGRWGSPTPTGPRLPGMDGARGLQPGAPVQGGAGAAGGASFGQAAQAAQGAAPRPRAGAAR